MARKISNKTLINASKMYERAKLDRKIDEWRGKMISTQDPVKRAEARMKMIGYQRQKQDLRLRKKRSSN